MALFFCPGINYHSFIHERIKSYWKVSCFLWAVLFTYDFCVDALLPHQLLRRLYKVYLWNAFSPLTHSFSILHCTEIQNKMMLNNLKSITILTMISMSPMTTAFTTKISGSTIRSFSRNNLYQSCRPLHSTIPNLDNPNNNMDSVNNRLSITRFSGKKYEPDNETLRPLIVCGPSGVGKVR